MKYKAGNNEAWLLLTVVRWLEEIGQDVTKIKC